MSHYHALVWIDHSEARIYHFNPAEVEHLVIHPHDPTQHIHHKTHVIGSGHAHEDPEYLERVAAALADAGAVLVTGPANAKTELVTYIGEHHPDLARRIAGVETVGHPTDGELVAHARHYFKAADRMTLNP